MNGKQDASPAKLCDYCKTKHPAKTLIQCTDYYLIVCDECAKKLNKVPGEQHIEYIEYESNKMGIYENDMQE